MANLQPSFPRKRESSERLVTTVNPGYISSDGCNTLLEPDKRKTLALYRPPSDRQRVMQTPHNHRKPLLHFPPPPTTLTIT